MKPFNLLFLNLWVVATVFGAEKTVPGISIEATFKHQSGKEIQQSDISLIASEKNAWLVETDRPVNKKYPGGKSSKSFGLENSQVSSNRQFFSLSLLRPSPLLSVLPMCSPVPQFKQMTETLLESFDLSVEKKSNIRKIAGFESVLFHLTGKGLLKSIRDYQQQPFSVEGKIWVTDFSKVPNEILFFLIQLGSPTSKNFYRGNVFRMNLEGETRCSVLETDLQIFDLEFRRVLGEIGGVVLSSEIVFKENQKSDQVLQLEITKISKKNVPAPESKPQRLYPSQPFPFELKDKQDQGKVPKQTLSSELKSLSKHMEEEVRNEMDQIFSKICEMEKKYFSENKNFKRLEPNPRMIPGLYPMAANTCSPGESEKKKCNDWVNLGIIEEGKTVFCQYVVDSFEKEKVQGFEALASCDLDGDSLPSHNLMKGSVDSKTGKVNCKRD